MLAAVGNFFVGKKSERTKKAILEKWKI